MPRQARFQSAGKIAARSLRCKPGLISKERLRTRYLPKRVRILFVGESPPASGRFFYCADSGLYHAMKNAFETAFPSLRKTHFLESFRSLGCYLVDLCGSPVDRLDPGLRRQSCKDGEPRLSRTIRRLRPKIIVAVVRSIGNNVRQAEARAGWAGLRVEVPYPGRWHFFRKEFQRKLVPVLRRALVSNGQAHSILQGGSVKAPNH